MLVSLVYGDDYYTADGRGVVITTSGVPALTGATVVMKVKVGDAVVQLSGSVNSASECEFQITSTQIGTIGVGNWKFDVEATLTNGHVITVLRNSTLHIAEDVR